MPLKRPEMDVQMYVRRYSKDSFPGVTPEVTMTKISMLCLWNNMANKPVSVKLKIGIAKHGNAVLEKDGGAWICGKHGRHPERWGHSAVSLQKREEKIHISRKKNWGCEGPRMWGVPRSSEELIRRSTPDGHDTKVHTTSQGRASFGDRDPEMSQALHRTHSHYIRLVLQEIPQLCLQFSSVHPVRNEAAWGINYSGNSWIDGLLYIGLDSFTWFPFIILISSDKRGCTLEGKWICEVPILRCLQQ